MKFKFEQILENVYEEIKNSQDETATAAKKQQLIHHIQELVGEGDPNNVLGGISLEELQKMYDMLLRSHKEVEAYREEHRDEEEEERIKKSIEDMDKDYPV